MCTVVVARFMSSVDGTVAAQVSCIQETYGIVSVFVSRRISDQWRAFEMSYCLVTWTENHNENEIRRSKINSMSN